MLESDKIKKLDVLLDMLGEGKLDNLIDKEEFHRRLQGSPAKAGTMELMLDMLYHQMGVLQQEITTLYGNMDLVEADLRSVVKAAAHLTNTVSSYDYDQARNEIRNLAMKNGISI